MSMYSAQNKEWSLGTTNVALFRKKINVEKGSERLMIRT